MLEFYKIFTTPDRIFTEIIERIGIAKRRPQADYANNRITYIWTTR